MDTTCLRCSYNIVISLQIKIQPLNGYPGCKQADETVVMRSLFWYYSLNHTADNLLNICEGGNTTTLQEYDAFDKAGDSIRDVQWLL